MAQSGWDYESASSYVTFSFWVRSSLAGTYYVTYRARDNSNNLQHVKSFTLVADTWTKVTHTITTGTFNNDNGEGLRIMIFGLDQILQEVAHSLILGMIVLGATIRADYAQSWSNTASATFDVTGVQMEVGEKATPFEHRSYGDDLARCQRYYYYLGIGIFGPFVTGSNGTNGYFGITLPVTMRTAPSLEYNSLNDFTVNNYDASNVPTSFVIDQANNAVVGLYHSIWSYLH